MEFIKGILDGVYIIKPEPIQDNRGFFARSFCKEEFLKYKLETNFVQCNISYNKKSGTFRGMHYQEKPYEETKVILCLNGSICDIILDVRPESPTYGKWESNILSNTDCCSLYIPKGYAHGYQTLTDNAVVYYLVSAPYSEKHARTVFYKDFGIELLTPVTAISEKDNHGYQ
jgi:dTDP-4-dehydrorhamnose 3,5-epimerase